jgi:hypothetical protein
VALLEKGLAAMPDKCNTGRTSGSYYWNVHDYTKAANAFKRGAAIAGAPLVDAVARGHHARPGR